MSDFSRSLKESLAPVVTVLGFLALVVGLFVTRVEYVALAQRVNTMEDRLYGGRPGVAFMLARPIPIRGDRTGAATHDASDQAGALDWTVLGLGVALLTASLWVLWTQGGPPAELPAPLAGTRETRLLTRRKMLDKAGVPEC